jgi:F0F1-type ATP synthase membrane subunit c/vacuolar-type H+-ATPase subunit K
LSCCGTSVTVLLSGIGVDVAVAGAGVGMGRGGVKTLQARAVNKTNNGKTIFLENAEFISTPKLPEKIKDPCR